MTEEFEKEIIRSVLGGNTDAFEARVTEYEAGVYRLCLRMTGNSEDAADMTQECFVKVYRSLSSFRGDSRFSAWVYRIASNVCLDFLRSKSKRQTVSLTRDGEDDDGEECEIPDLRSLPEDSLESSLVRDAVRRGLDTLSPDQRQILILRELGGLSHEAIGSRLGLEAGTVKSRIFRARKRLCAFLTKDGNIPDFYTSTAQGGERK